MSEQPTKSKQKKQRKPREIKFIHLSAPEASGDKSLGTLSALRQSSCVYTEYLGLRSEDVNIVQDMYKNSQVVDILYSATDADSQLQAAEYLKQLSLDEASQNQLGSKWTTVWASEKNGKGGGRETIRKLYGW